jgi:DNA (cytosine-5)-methyltransferase 1
VNLKKFQPQQKATTTTTTTTTTTKKKKQLHMVLKIGTDCSGLDAPITALKNLKVDFSHEFSSDIDLNCRKEILANHRPKILFEDMSERNVADVPFIDLYVCGFPCQAFSIAGKKEGFKAENGGNIFFECVKTIRHCKPKIFVLENTNTLQNHDQGKTFKIILQKLHDLKKYNIYHQILNTRHYGIPQNRRRIYIVGVKKTIRKPFQFPEPVRCKSLPTFIDHTNQTRDPWNRADDLSILPKNSVFVNVNYLRSSHFPHSGTYSPALLTQGTLWCVPYHRRATIKEHLKLQGFPADFKQVVSNSSFKKEIGNAMSVNVIQAVLKNCLACLDA